MDFEYIRNPLIEEQHDYATQCYRKGDGEVETFKCRECGAEIPVDEQGKFAGMQVSGPCPKCGCVMPFICPECNQLAVDLFITNNGNKCYKCQSKMMKKQNGCYIATACYGSYDHPDVLVFRRFRDELLLPLPLGRLFIKAYYTLSPPIAERLGHVYWLSRFIRRWFLEPLAKRLR